MIKLLVLALVCFAFQLADVDAKKPTNRADSLEAWGECYGFEMDGLINIELEAFYAYLQMGNFFAHESYYLPGLSKFLLENSQQKLKDAQKMIEFYHKRGSHVTYHKIEFGRQFNTINNTWPNATVALEEILELEFELTVKIEELHKTARKPKNVCNANIHLQDFLESDFIPQQYDQMKMVADKLKTLKRVTRTEPKDLAEFQFDKLVMQEQK